MTNDIIVIKLWAQNQVRQLFPECTESYLRASEISKIFPEVISPGTPAIVLREGKWRRKKEILGKRKKRWKGKWRWEGEGKWSGPPGDKNLVKTLHVWNHCLRHCQAWSAANVKRLELKGTVWSRCFGLNIAFGISLRVKYSVFHYIDTCMKIAILRNF